MSWSWIRISHPSSPEDRQIIREITDVCAERSRIIVRAADVDLAFDMQRILFAP